MEDLLIEERLELVHQVQKLCLILETTHKFVSLLNFQKGIFEDHLFYSFWNHILIGARNRCV